MTSEIQEDIGKKIFYVEDYQSVFLKNLILHGVDLRRRLQDYDPLNKSLIKVPQFQSIVNSLKFNINERELDQICDKYRVNGEFIDY